MEKTITFCDFTGKSNPTRLQFYLGKEMDASGNGYNDIVISVDVDAEYLVQKIEEYLKKDTNLSNCLYSLLKREVCPY